MNWLSCLFIYSAHATLAAQWMQRLDARRSSASSSLFFLELRATRLLSAFGSCFNFCVDYSLQYIIGLLLFVYRQCYVKWKLKTSAYAYRPAFHYRRLSGASTISAGVLHTNFEFERSVRSCSSWTPDVSENPRAHQMPRSTTEVGGPWLCD